MTSCASETDKGIVRTVEWDGMEIRTKPAQYGTVRIGMVPYRTGAFVVPGCGFVGAGV